MKKMESNEKRHERLEHVLETALQLAINKFNRRVENDTKVRDALQNTLGQDGKRRVLIDTTEGIAFNFLLTREAMVDLRKGRIEDPDIYFNADTETYLRILTGTLNPLRAYVTGKLKVNMTFADMLALRKFFECK